MPRRKVRNQVAGDGGVEAMPQFLFLPSPFRILGKQLGWLLFPSPTRDWVRGKKTTTVLVLR